MKFNPILSLFLFFGFLMPVKGAEISRDTSKVPMPVVPSATNLINDYSIYFRRAQELLKVDSLDQGLMLLSTGIKQLNADKKVLRACGYAELEIISFIDLICSHKLNKEEELFGKSLFRKIINNPNSQDYLKDVELFEKSHGGSDFVERVRLMLELQYGKKSWEVTLQRVQRKNQQLQSLNVLVGVMLQVKGKYEEAVQAYSEVIKNYPYYAFAYNRRADCYAALKDTQKAFQDYNKVLSLFPEYYEVYVKKGALHKSLKEFRPAIENFKKILSLNPGLVNLNYDIAKAYNELELPDSALFYARNYTVSFPESSEGYKLQGDIYYDQNKNKEAIQSYSEAIKQDKEDAALYADRGSAYYYDDQTDAAISDLLLAYKLDKDYTYVIDRLGDCFKEKKDYDSAIKWYQKALKSDKTYKYSYVGLGRIYSEQKQYELAIKAYKEAVKIDSTYDSALGNLGWTYYCAGRFKECIDYSYRALKFDKEAVYAMFNIPLATLRLGEYEKAKDLYKYFIAHCKENGYEISKGAEEDLRDLIRDNIMNEEAEYILQNYFNIAEKTQ